MRILPFGCLLLVLPAFLGSLGCGSEDAALPPADLTIEVVNNKYTPADATIKPGQTVEWVFKQGVHDVASGTKTGPKTCVPDGKFQSELLSSGTFRHTFAAAGDYPYFCTPHCELNMVATIHVK